MKQFKSGGENGGGGCSLRHISRAICLYDELHDLLIYILRSGFDFFFRVQWYNLARCSRRMATMPVLGMGEKRLFSDPHQRSCLVARKRERERERERERDVSSKHFLCTNLVFFPHWMYRLEDLKKRGSEIEMLTKS